MSEGENKKSSPQNSKKKEKKMNKLFTIIALLAVTSFAETKNDDRAPEMALPQFTIPSHDLVRAEVPVVAPEKKELEIKAVETMETPFVTVAWENNRLMREEYNEINLGIGF